MMGFAVSTVAVIMAAWFGYVAGRAGRPRVPAGTTHARKDATYEAIAATPGTQHPVCSHKECPAYAPFYCLRELRAHVALDDRIYGRNG